MIYTYFFHKKNIYLLILNFILKKIRFFYINIICIRKVKNLNKHGKGKCDHLHGHKIAYLIWDL